MSEMEGPGAYRGRTSIHPRAIRAIGTVLAADSAQVPRCSVALSLGDRSGDLAVTVTVPAVVGAAEKTTLPERAAALREHLRAELARLAARSVVAVDVRYDGVHHAARRRAS